MKIERSTLEFLLIAIILGSIMAMTLHFGYGPAVLLMIFWGVVVFFFLRNKKKKAARPTAQSAEKEQNR